jgi:HTH-type transcriptional regulator/antitoxin HigA
MSDMNSNEFAPNYASPPGDTLLEALEERGMSQSELAERTGRPRKTINEIVRGRAEITPETALQLEYVLGIPAHFWNNRERRYREALARLDERDRLGKDLAFLDKIPVKAMTKCGWLPNVKDPIERMRAVLSFFGVASPEAFSEWAAERTPSFRQSSAHAIDPYAVLAWIRKGEIEARRCECAPYDQQVFRHNLGAIRDLTAQPVGVFEPRMKHLCAVAGVALVFVPELPKTCAWGVTQWLSADRALIQLSLRYKTDDHLWFTFFHEAGHILLHGKRGVFVESGRTKDAREQEADRFAADFLISSAQMEAVRRSALYSRAAVNALAKKIGIAPGILVGRLQHEEHIPRSHLNDLKRRLQFRSADERGDG